MKKGNKNVVHGNIKYRGLEWFSMRLPQIFKAQISSSKNITQTFLKDVYSEWAGKEWLNIWFLDLKDYFELWMIFTHHTVKINKGYVKRNLYWCWRPQILVVAWEKLFHQFPFVRSVHFYRMIRNYPLNHLPLSNAGSLLTQSCNRSEMQKAFCFLSDNTFGHRMTLQTIHCADSCTLLNWTSYHITRSFSAASLIIIMHYKVTLK